MIFFRFFRRGLLAATALAGLAAALPAVAQNGLPTITGQVAAIGQTISLSVGGQTVVEIGSGVTRIALGNPQVADVSNAGPRQIRILGLSEGSTDLVLWRGRDVTRMRLSVAGDVDGARAAAGSDPSLSRAQVGSEGGRVVLRGEVPDLEAHQRLVALARPRGGEIVDMTRIAQPMVVAVEVKFAAVSAQRLRSIGFDFKALGRSLQGGVLPPGSGTDLSGGLPAPIGSAFNLVLGNSRNNILAALSLLSSTDFAQMLAEPVLLVRSGEQASFLAGGEIPIPVPQAGIGGSASVTIDYKPFGVRLDVAPVVMAGDRILLRVSPEVSELDYTNAVTIQGFSVPAFRKRSTSTTVELGSGQSFMIAGMTFNNVGQLDERVPGLGQLPIIGTFLSRVRAQREQQELVIIATPRLVRPMEAGSLPPLPGAPGNSAPMPSSLDQVLQRNTAADAAARFGLLR